jgi:hypothetical protein
VNTPIHVLNWQIGWWLILLSFVTGAGIGLFFHREDFLGGYNSFRRRIVRLGHIALAALGMLNVIFSYSSWPVPETTAATVASFGFVVGGIAMPSVCFLTGWRAWFRMLFFIPVLALLIAVSFTIGGAP